MRSPRTGASEILPSRNRGSRTAITLLVCLLALAAVGEAATEKQPPTLGEDAELGDYLAYAALGNPRLEAAFQRWQAALAKIEQVETLPDPKLAYAYFIENVETRIGPQQQKLGVAQAVPWLSKLRLRGAVATETAKAAEREYQAVKLALFFEVADAFYELYYLGRSIGITEDNLALLTHLESVAQANFKAGAPMSGVVKAQVEMGVLDDRVRTLRDLRIPLVARLNAALNRPVEAPVAWPRVAPSRSVDLTDQELLLWMKSDNPELQGLDFEIARDELAVELASKEFRPNFMVGLDWVDVGQAVNPSLPGSGDDTWVAKVSVSVPIWRSKYRAGVEETTRRHDASLKRRDDAENVLAANLKLALFGFRDAERKIHLFQHTLVPLAEASLEVAQEAYMAGKEDFLSLIDAQRLLLEFQLNYERSLADREQRLAELEKVVGRPLVGRQ